MMSGYAAESYNGCSSLILWTSSAAPFVLCDRITMSLLVTWLSVESSIASSLDLGRLKTLGCAPAGKSAISGHWGLHVIVMKKSGLPRFLTMAIASWKRACM